MCAWWFLIYIRLAGILSGGVNPVINSRWSFMILRYCILWNWFLVSFIFSRKWSHLGLPWAWPGSWVLYFLLTLCIWKLAAFYQNLYWKLFGGIVVESSTDSKSCELCQTEPLPRSMLIQIQTIKKKSHAAALLYANYALTHSYASANWNQLYSKALQCWFERVKAKEAF